ncbi:MAG: RND family transporter, partial [Pseudomonadota bacterium]
MTDSHLVRRLESLIFRHRLMVVGAFAAVTLVMVFFAFQLRVDAGFTKLLPVEHEYMQTFTKYRQEFGGANRILVALVAKEGDIFTAEFFQALRQATDELFF